MSLDTSINVSVRAALRKSLDLDVAQDPLSFTRTVTLTNGAGANQADQSFHDKRTLAASSSEELDVAGSLSDAFGDTITLARVKVLYVKNLSAGDKLIIGGAAANALGLFSDASDKLELRPGGIVVITAPDADGVAVGSNDKLKLAHSGDTTTNLDYEIVLIGASA
jgi:hypothetical protein